jgi:hypothetical protein
MTISDLRDKIQQAVTGVALQSPFTQFDFMEGYLYDMNTIHDRVNPFVILNIFKSVEDKIQPIADHSIKLNFLYNITQAMEVEVVQYSQDYYHTLFSKFDVDINAVLTAIFANDDINLKSNITRTRSPYNSNQKLWLVQVEFTLQTFSECFFI